MIGDAQDVARRRPLDKIDRTAQHEPTVDRDRILEATFIAAVIRKSKAELEILRHPRRIVCHLLHPDAEVAAQLVDFVAPDARNRRRKLLFVLSRHTCERGVDDLRGRSDTIGRHRQRAGVPHVAIELGLSAMEEAATRQWIEPHQRFWLFSRLEAIDRREQKLIRTRCKSLERRQRVRAVRQTLFVDRGLERRRHANQAIRLRPRRPSTRPAADDRATQRLVELQQVVRVSPHRRGVARLEQRLERREIVFEIVDRAIRIFRRRPREACAGFSRSVARKLTMIRNLAGDGAHDVERIERRHARARFGDVEPGIREIEAVFRRANRQLQQQPLGVLAILLTDKVAAQRVPPVVEQQRILMRTLRHHALGETRNEDDFERAATRLVRRADEDAAVAPCRRLPVEHHQPLAQHVAHFLETDGADIRHRPQRCQRLENAIGTAQRGLGQRDEAIEPLTPRRAIRPCGKRIDDGQREVAEVTEIFQVALVPPDTRRFGFLALQRLDPQLVVVLQAIETPAPPLAAVRAGAASDNRRLDDELFPLPRRSQCPGNHGFFV